jgi:glycosyltransferase involved in cell wall biosynthesis
MSAIETLKAPPLYGAMKDQMIDVHSSVDVLIPVYNAEATLEEAIASILCQTLGDIRVVVVDDGSTDKSAAILEAFRAKDARICVLRQPNSGIVDALNFGLAHCTAKYVARFDADDVAFPDHLKNLSDYLDKYEDCVAVGSAVEHMDEVGRTLRGLPHPGSPSNADPMWVPAIEPYLIHPFMMARRLDLLKVGGYRYVFNSEDSDLYWRLSEHGRLHNLVEIGGRYRVHKASVSSKSIVSGRIMAINSQLAAISVIRRRKKATDICFDKEALAKYKASSTLSEMWIIASQQLTYEERGHLKIAASIKLLELAGYRPFQLDTSDYDFIRSALLSGQRTSRKNRKIIRWYLSRAAMQLASQHGWHYAFARIPSTAYGMALAKVALYRTGLRAHV